MTEILENVKVFARPRRLCRRRRRQSYDNTSMFSSKKKVELIKPSLFPRKHEHLESLYFIKSTRNSETERKRKKKKKKKKKKEKWGFTFITWLYFTSCAASVCFIVFTESSPSDDFYVSLSI